MGIKLTGLKSKTDSGGRKLRNFEGNRDNKFGVKGGYPLENSLVLAHLFTAYGQFCYFFLILLFVFFIFLFFFLLRILGGHPPHWKFYRGTHPPPRLHRLWGQMYAISHYLNLKLLTFSNLQVSIDKYFMWSLPKVSCNRDLLQWVWSYLWIYKDLSL